MHIYIYIYAYKVAEKWWIPVRVPAVSWRICCVCICFRICPLARARAEGEKYFSNKLSRRNSTTMHRQNATAPRSWRIKRGEEGKEGYFGRRSKGRSVGWFQRDHVAGGHNGMSRKNANFSLRGRSRVRSGAGGDWSL